MPERAAFDETVAAGEPALARTATGDGTGAPAPSATLATGVQLGHFRIEKPLGAGGMGEVYLATDLALDRRVALKVLPESVASEPARRDRMIKEARAQARVSHPNVAHIYFIGEEHKRLYFAMEYIAGETLADKLAKGPLAVPDALAIIRSAALGLREAQRSGFTHRDVKPSNLMLDAHGLVKVVDFGLAAGGAERANDDGPVEQTSIAGTPLYMAPEQARGEAVDFRADIYALGATLYQLVSGAPPFVAETAGALISLHATAARPTLRRRSGQARTEITVIDALCARMMALSPADRFESYDELIRELELASESHTRPAGAAVRTLATFVDLVLAGVAAALIVLAVSALGIFDSDFDGNLPIFGVLYLYFALASARWGRTVGQALLEIEVVDIATGARPRLGQAFGRTTIVMAVPLGGFIASFIASRFDLELLGVVDLSLFIVYTLTVPVTMMWASVRAPGKRTLWDRWTKTMVRYRTRRSSVL